MEAIPVPDWHHEALAERLAAYDANPDEQKTWEEFEGELAGETQGRSSDR